jgi:hypothetical protein
MKFEVFIDTQSLFYDIRKHKGSGARMDFKKVKDNIHKHVPEDAEITCIHSFITTKGSSNDSFANMLSSFDHTVYQVDRGTQDMEFAMSIAESIHKFDGIILICGHRNIGPIIDRMLKYNKDLYIVSILDLWNSDSDIQEKLESLKLIDIDSDWLWSRD